MPIYEYRCAHCNRKSTLLVRSPSSDRQPVCSHCQSQDMVRLVSTFSVRTPWYSSTSIPSSETLGDFDENDPASTAQWIEGMQRDMGSGFGSGEYDELMSDMGSGGMDGDASDDLDL